MEMRTGDASRRINNPPQGQREQKGNELSQPSPNHFLALQVSQHPQAVAAINGVQASLAAHSPHLAGACVEPVTAHLTLGVLFLGSGEDCAAAAAALAALAEPLEDLGLLAPLEVQLEGLSHFRNEVLYLDLWQDGGHARLLQLAAAARSHFAERGLLQQAERSFVPHITIAKTSRLRSPAGLRGGRGGGRGRHGGRRAKQPRLERQPQSDRPTIPEEAWAPHCTIAGGRAVLAEIQLCAMQGRQPGQYYPVLCSLPLLQASSHGGTRLAAKQPAG